MPPAPASRSRIRWKSCRCAKPPPPRSSAPRRAGAGHSDPRRSRAFGRLRFMLERLSRDDRLRLMKFVCSFAWADLRVQEEERSFVKKLVRKLKLDAEE